MGPCNFDNTTPRFACDRRADDCTKAFIKERMAFFCQHQLLAAGQDQRTQCLQRYKQLLEDVAAEARPGAPIDGDKWTAACRRFSAANEGLCRPIRPESLRNALKSFFGARWEHGAPRNTNTSNTQRKAPTGPVTGQVLATPVAQCQTPAEYARDMGRFVQAAVKDFATHLLLPGSDNEHGACVAAYRSLLDEALCEYNRYCAFDKSRRCTALCAAKYGAKCRDFSLAYAAACRWVCPAKFRAQLEAHAGVRWQGVHAEEPEAQALVRCPLPPYVDTPCAVCRTHPGVPLLCPVPEVRGSPAEVQLGVAELMLFFFRCVLRVGGRVPPASLACQRTDASRSAFSRLVVTAVSERGVGRPLSAPKWTRRLYYFSETYGDICNFFCPAVLRRQFGQCLRLEWVNEDAVLRCPGVPGQTEGCSTCCDSETGSSALAARKQVAEGIRERLVHDFFELELLQPAWRECDDAAARVVVCRADFRRLVWSALEEWATFGDGVAFPAEQWSEFYETHGDLCDASWAAATQFERFVNYRVYVTARREMLTGAGEKDESPCKPMPPLEVVQSPDAAEPPTLASLFAERGAWDARPGATSAAPSESEDDPLAHVPSWEAFQERDSMSRAHSARSTPVPPPVCDTVDAAVWAEPEHVHASTPSEPHPVPPVSEIDTMICYVFITEVLRTQFRSLRGSGMCCAFEMRFVEFVKECLEAWMRAAQTLHADAQMRAERAIAMRWEGVYREYAAVCEESWRDAGALFDLLIRLRNGWWSHYRAEKFRATPDVFEQPKVVAAEMVTGVFFNSQVLRAECRDKRDTFPVATCESHFRQLMWDAVSQYTQQVPFDTAVWESRWRQFVHLHLAVCDEARCTFDAFRTLLSTYLQVQWESNVAAEQAQAPPLSNFITRVARTPPHSPVATCAQPPQPVELQRTPSKGLNVDAAPFVVPQTRRIPTPPPTAQRAGFGTRLSSTSDAASCAGSVESDTADRHSPVWAVEAAPRSAQKWQPRPTPITKTPPSSPPATAAKPPATETLRAIFGTRGVAKITTPPAPPADKSMASASPFHLPAAPPTAVAPSPRVQARDSVPSDDHHLLSTTEEESPGPSECSKSPSVRKMSAWFRLRNSQLPLGAMSASEADDTSSGCGTHTHRSMSNVATHREEGVSPRVSDPWLQHMRRKVCAISIDGSQSHSPQTTHRSFATTSDDSPRDAVPTPQPRKHTASEYNSPMSATPPRLNLSFGEGSPATSLASSKLFDASPVQPQRVPQLNLLPLARADRTGFEDAFGTPPKTQRSEVHGDRDTALHFNFSGATNEEAPVELPFTIEMPTLDDVDLTPVKEEKPKKEIKCTERPCDHNDWTELRCKRGRRQVRCAVCSVGWRMPAEIPTCSDYWASGDCPRGDDCTQHHIRPRRRAKEAAAAAAAAALEAANDVEDVNVEVAAAVPQLPAQKVSSMTLATTPRSDGAESCLSTISRPMPLHISPHSMPGFADAFEAPATATPLDTPRTDKSLSASLTAPSRSSAFAPLLPPPAEHVLAETNADAHKHAFRALLQEAMGDIQTGAPLCAVKYAWSCFKFSRRFPNKWIDPVRFRERLIVQLGARWINEMSVPQCLLIEPQEAPASPSMSSKEGAGVTEEAESVEERVSGGVACSESAVSGVTPDESDMSGSHPPSHCDSPLANRRVTPSLDGTDVATEVSGASSLTAQWCLPTPNGKTRRKARRGARRATRV